MIFCFLFTAHSNARSDQVVKREICAVITKGIYVVPFLQFLSFLVLQYNLFANRWYLEERNINSLVSLELKTTKETCKFMLLLKKHDYLGYLNTILHVERNLTGQT